MQMPDQEKKRPGRADCAKTLREAWQETLTDDSVGTPAEEVFLRLERKYQIAAGQSLCNAQEAPVGSARK